MSDKQPWDRQNHPAVERRSGRSRLVYDKATRTIRPDRDRMRELEAALSFFVRYGRENWALDLEGDPEIEAALATADALLAEDTKQADGT